MDGLRMDSTFPDSYICVRPQMTFRLIYCYSSIMAAIRFDAHPALPWVFIHHTSSSTKWSIKPWRYTSSATGARNVWPGREWYHWYCYIADLRHGPLFLMNPFYFLAYYSISMKPDGRVRPNSTTRVVVVTSYKTLNHARLHAYTMQVLQNLDGSISLEVQVIFSKFA